MTTADLISIVGAVALLQFVCDFLSHYLVYRKDPYQTLLGRLSRDQLKLQKLQETYDDQSKKAGRSEGDAVVLSEKQRKKLNQMKNDIADHAAEIAKKHMIPYFYSSIAFFLLYRILATEYSGKVVAVLPFAPPSILLRITMSGLPMETPLPGFEPMLGIKDPTQVCSLLFIYLMATLTVKFYVNKAFGSKLPKGADNGIFALMDAPQTQKMLKSWGLDNESLGKVD